MSERTRRYFRVRGRVQGVGFRYFARATATQLGLAGHVKNRPDGDVELEAEGGLEALESLRSAIRKGPPGARVDEVLYEQRPLAVASEDGFLITS